MTDTRRDVTDSELAVLDVLWERPDATIREITEAIYQSYSPSAHATVQKLLERLEGKRCVTRDRSGFAHRFRAVVARADLIGRELEAVADKLCEGSLTPLLLHLAGRTQLTPEERRQLRKLIDGNRG
ncbi:MAG: BlaI/MecI/CopY family transcriptional regulator [Planctomycetaceae bacterium]|nr:BlaI/MecI/CopY family transcriptional regulator [Planctomycetaceae bacterium]